jgi:hypothetical protein
MFVSLEGDRGHVQPLPPRAITNFNSATAIAAATSSSLQMLTDPVLSTDRANRVQAAVAADPRSACNPTHPQPVSLSSSQGRVGESKIDSGAGTECSGSEGELALGMDVTAGHHRPDRLNPASEPFDSVLMPARLADAINTQYGTEISEIGHGLDADGEGGEEAELQLHCLRLPDDHEKAGGAGGADEVVMPRLVEISPLAALLDLQVVI